MQTQKNGIIEKNGVDQLLDEMDRMAGLFAADLRTLIADKDSETAILSNETAVDFFLKLVNHVDKLKKISSSNNNEGSAETIMQNKIGNIQDISLSRFK